MIKDHPFLDNNGPTYMFGVCRECGMSYNVHTHRNVQKAPRARIYTEPVDDPQEPTEQEIQEGKRRVLEEFSGKANADIVKSQGGWRITAPVRREAK